MSSVSGVYSGESVYGGRADIFSTLMSTPISAVSHLVIDSKTVFCVTREIVLPSGNGSAFGRDEMKAS